MFCRPVNMYCGADENGGKGRKSEWKWSGTTIRQEHANGMVEGDEAKEVRVNQDQSSESSESRVVTNQALWRALWHIGDRHVAEERGEG